jgi:hypothetical protein
MRLMQIRRRSAVWALLAVLCAGGLVAVLVAVLTPGIGGGTRQRPTFEAAAAGAGGQLPSARGAAAAPSTAADRAIQLEALLGQHAVLAADVMRSRVRGDDDFVQAANAALGKNTDDMTGLIGQLFGDATAKKFQPLWSQHIVELVAYASALADQDDAAKAQAHAKLSQYEGVLAAFFAGASQGRLPLSAARAAVAMHVEHLVQQADAYAAKDYATSDRLYRECFEHTYDLGMALAGALLPVADTKTLQQPIWRLRSQLGRLLAEHAVLIEDVTRAAVSNTPDFTAAGANLNANTRDIAAAIDTLFGSAAAKSFQNLWAAHVEQLVAYSAATAAKDTAKQDQARANLTSFEQRMAAFLNAATEKKMSTSDLLAALKDHDQMLMRHADEYGAKDYQSAHDIAYATYDHMFELARQLADAFGSSVAARLPRGAAQTGYGGLAGVVGSR